MEGIKNALFLAIFTKLQDEKQPLLFWNRNSMINPNNF